MKRLILSLLTVALLPISMWADAPDTSKKYFLKTKYDGVDLYMNLTSGNVTLTATPRAVKFVSATEGKYYLVTEEGNKYLGYTGTENDKWTIATIDVESAAALTVDVSEGTIQGTNGYIGIQDKNVSPAEGRQLWGNLGTSAQSGFNHFSYQWTFIEASTLESGYYLMQSVDNPSSLYDYYTYIKSDGKLWISNSQKSAIYMNVSGSNAVLNNSAGNSLTRNSNKWTTVFDTNEGTSWTIETYYNGSVTCFALRSDYDSNNKNLYLADDTSERALKADATSAYKWKFTEAIDTYGDATSLLLNADCTDGYGWTNYQSVNTGNIDWKTGTADKSVFQPTKNTIVTQTIANLPAGTYTVQVAVRGSAGEKASLKLNSGTAVEASLSGGNTKNGRMGKNGLVAAHHGDGPTDNGGWDLLQSTATVSAGGSLQIDVAGLGNTGSSWWQMCDVKLLKDADTDGKYQTGANQTYTDLTGDAKYYFYTIADNALVKSSANASNLPNVIVDGTCAKLKLKEGAYNFGNTGSDFTATSVTYDRTFTADNKSTICLPFALTTEEAAALGKFYTLSSYSDNTLYFEEVTTGVEAYKPYLFVPTATSFSEYSSKTIAANPGSLATTVSENAASFIGTMTAQSLQSGSETYYGYSSDGTFKKVNVAHINPFRAYISIPGTSPTPAPAMLSISLGGTTGIENAVKSEEKKDKSYYDLQGRRVQQPTKGLYIVNGKKVIIK